MLVSHHRYAPKSDAERKANARLIATAPDLLAACQAAVNTILNSGVVDWRMMQAAIDKATKP